MTRGVLRTGVLGLAIVASALAAPAWAQSGTGVSAALVGEIVRSDGAIIDYVTGEPRDGEGLTFSLRLDRALGARWGVELEYVHGAELKTEISRRGLMIPPELAGAAIFDSSMLVPGSYTSTYATRWSTIAPMLWYRQPIGSRTSLVYSAGMAFGIAKSESTSAYLGLPNQNTIPASTIKYTSYTINPVVGFDARIGMTDHLSVVPGIRLLGGDGGILLRPAAGLRWEF